MPVEQVQPAQPELVGPAGLLVQEFDLVLDDEDSLDVVGIPEFVDRAGVEDRLVEREADLLLSSDRPAPELCRGLVNSRVFPLIRSRQCAPATCNDPGWCLKNQADCKTVVMLMKKPALSCC